MIITITTTMIATMILLVTCKAAGLSAITSAACLRALLALCSPSAAITWTRGGDYHCDQHCHDDQDYHDDYLNTRRDYHCYDYDYRDSLVIIVRSSLPL